MSGRKRSRWGEPQSRPDESKQVISDQDALQALLSSAAQREEDKQRLQKSRKNDHYRPHEKSKSTGRVLGDRRPKDDHHTEHHTGEQSSTEQSTEKQNPDFGLSGALAKDERHGNMYKGVVLKFQEPPEARAPNTLWRLYVFKGKEQLNILHISRQSAYLIGRNEEIADIPVQHQSCSSQHAVLQYRALPNKETGRLQCQPYIMDLESTNGTFLNGVQIEPARYYQLKKGDVLKFGASTREYVLLTANAKGL